ncbi:MAG: Zinc/iron permease [Candidatus Nomurabacteria bacterium GW2011_GWB1_47_6]|uniref:Zinc/iron permease n=1 Tax=Candidatus Nomurabacteria bacterium GW2011_GWB1_47_6 TaxID=1618749 RepID=A0A0G1V7S9_9BACT|nr:MAG: Zinc/iron permease [Candidatus Nomurabacteria bacterium GW2011_GWB1_47_6]
MIITTYVYALLSVLIVSLVSLIGAFALSIQENILKKYIFMFISLAVGALLGDSFIHLIPEAFESGIGSATVSILIILGIILFFILEKFMHWHHHGEDEAEQGIHPAGQLILLSDGVHNFIDGVSCRLYAQYWEPWPHLFWGKQGNNSRSGFCPSRLGGLFMSRLRTSYRNFTKPKKSNIL